MVDAPSFGSRQVLIKIEFPSTFVVSIASGPWLASTLDFLLPERLTANLDAGEEVEGC